MQQQTCAASYARREARLPIDLVLAFYEMDETNTPGVGTVLRAYGLRSIPEAHCLLRYKGRDFDFTMPPGTRVSEPKRFLHREIIKPAQIGAYKFERHRRFLQGWLGQSSLSSLGLDQAWSIREACIEALSER